MARSIRKVSVAVVGGAGFLGSHLVDVLVEDRDCDVVVVDNLVAGKREFVHPKAKFEHWDITGDEGYLRGVFASHKVQFVFNYAAMPYVPDSYKHPLRVFNVNAFGAMKVINAAQEAGAEAILQVSSAEVFKDLDDRSLGDMGGIKALDELAEINPHSSYGSSKAAIDYYCQTAWKERRTPVVALRQFNCYGPRPLHDYVIPTIVDQLHKTGTKLKLGNNSARDFQYAGDAVKFAVELLERGQYGEVYNSGSEECLRIYDLAQKISDVAGFGRVTIEQDPARLRKWEIWSLKSCNTKMYLVVSHRPQVSLEEGLQKTVAYYRENGGWDFNGEASERG